MCLYVLVCYSHVVVCYSYVLLCSLMLPVRTRMLLVCYWYVLVFLLVCTRMYSYVLVCTRMLLELSDLSIPARPISLEERQTGFLSFPKREDSAGSNARFIFLRMCKLQLWGEHKVFIFLFSYYATWSLGSISPVFSCPPLSGCW